MSLKQAILAIADLPTQRIDVPEWSMTVSVRSLNCAQRDEFLNLLMGRWDKGALKDARGIKTKLVQLCLIDEETGQPAFGADDLSLLDAKSPGAIDRIFDAAWQLSGLKGEEQSGALEKNSPAGANAGFGSS